MANKKRRIRVQVLLRDAWRNQAGRDAVARVFQDLGLEVTGIGAASLSVRGTPETLAKALGMSDVPADADGWGGELPVPASLGERVESLSVAPQHQTMSGRRAKPERDR